MIRGRAMARLFVYGAGLFFASAFVTIGELRYAVWGKTTTAEFRGTYPHTDKHGETYQLSVRYRFKDDDGQKQKGHDFVALDWKPPTDGKLRIEYVPGQFGKSRLAGNRNVAMLWIFAGSLAASVITVVVATCVTFWNGDPWKGIHGGADW
jgi:hypothetical protein